uniref:Uncharacterized protein n=1 Tax=Paramormyrops kingsleyae TaxID=1676925 RepID=A0A3B3QCI7_9TELE
MRQMQLQNQETLQLMLKDAEQEIGHKVAETLQRLEDPVQKQRALVEEERHKYLGMEEKVLAQLGDLEGYVESLRTDGSVTLKDVEDGAVGLQKVGEALAALRGEFPALQAKMRAVLRVEVEAVRFLKEEPHKLDSMLKRVKILTTMLGGLQRNGTVEDQEVSVPRMELETEPLEADIPELARSPPTHLPEGQGSAIRSEFMSQAPLIIHQTLSSPVQGQQAQKSIAPMCQASPPSTPVAPPTRERPTPIPESPATDTRALFIEEIHTRREKSQQRAMSIEAAERDWEEKRQNMTHYDGKDFEKVLQEAQANMMKGFPSMERTGQDEASPAPPADQPNEVDAQEVVCPPSGVPPPEGVREPGTEKPAKQNQTGKLQKPPTEPKPTLDRLSQAVTDKVGKLGAEKTGKSPPPPPPRKTYTLGSGMTTGRSGEVIFTARKESVTAQDEEEEVTSPQRSKPKVKSPTESKPKPLSPPPVTASGVRDEEDDANRIMTELQVFQKCTFKDVEAKCFVEHARVETQVREIRPGAMVSPRDRKSANPASSTSRMPVPISAKPRQPAGGAEKTGKQANLQDPHRQFRQANGMAKKAGGDIKTSPPTLPASKIPAFCPSSGKISSHPTSNSETTNPLSPTTSPTQPSPKSSIPSPHCSRPTPCNIPSLSNGSLKSPSPAHSGKSHHTSFSTQNQNGRPSPLSPTSLSHSGRSIRTIHTPSFTSHKPLNGKYAVPPASAASKDAS